MRRFQNTPLCPEPFKHAPCGPHLMIDHGSSGTFDNAAISMEMTGGGGGAMSGSAGACLCECDYRQYADELCLLFCEKEFAACPDD